jgi:hypothetical protein
MFFGVAGMLDYLRCTNCISHDLLCGRLRSRLAPAPVAVKKCSEKKIGNFTTAVGPILTMGIWELLSSDLNFPFTPAVSDVCSLLLMQINT